MILKTLAYREFPADHSRHWQLEEFELGRVNLFVGNNTSGKSRTLNVIYGLSTILQSPVLSVTQGVFNVTFQKDLQRIDYYLNIENGEIKEERFTLDGTIKFSRDEHGKGEIYNSDLSLNQKFSIPVNQVLATRRDEIQYPYLEDLFEWSSNVRHFRFSKEEEKQTLAVIDSNKSITESQNQNVTNQAIEIFRKGTAKFRHEFVNRVVKDFNSIGYDVHKIDVGSLQSVKIDSPIGNKIIGLRVHERDRSGFTDQNEMSDGMFRALSLLIHFNYYQLTEKNLSVLVDDIGEGLDFERSTNLIKLAIEKSLSSNIQLIMSSNDKFVMNNTNLKYWQVVLRKGGKVTILNHCNSKEKFEDFKFSGLNNFDFFVTESFLN